MSKSCCDCLYSELITNAYDLCQPAKLVCGKTHEEVSITDVCEKHKDLFSILNKVGNYE